ncbi:MAG: lysophospholipid acyltransferase family protein [Muribaculaceae bacterium]
MISTFKAMAHLPLGVLYVLSDIAAVVLHCVVRYRLDVVRKNLATSFPEKSKRELRRIESRFYHNFTDNFIETLKLLHISDKEMLGRMDFAGTEIIDDLMARGRSIVVYFGHFFNWEWAPSISLHTRLKQSDGIVFAQIYRPLSSKAFDALMLAIRSRFGSESIDKKTALRRLLMLRKSGTISITGFMSDQHPSHGDPGYITTLMGHPTAIITGTETLARKLDMSVIYWDMEKVSRGHYRITTRLIAENPNDLPEGEITSMYSKMLETTIRREPSIWLWSHKRWKHKVTPRE